MRIFSKNEREYLVQLAIRNVLDEKKITDGLEKPMSGKERIKRKRIKDKSMDAIHDIILVNLSGIAPIDILYSEHTSQILDVVKTNNKELSEYFLQNYMFESYKLLLTPIHTSENIILSIMKKSFKSKFKEKDNKLRIEKKERLEELKKKYF